MARDRNLQRFVTEQPPYSILVRHAEADILPTCARHGMGVLTYSPLAGGWLSGRWRTDSDLPTPSPSRQRLTARYDMSLPVNQLKLEAAGALRRLAEDAGLSLIEMAIAFVLNHPAVTSAIIGPRTLEHLESQLPAADIRLSADVLDRIDEIVARHPDQPRRLQLRQPRPPTVRPSARRLRPNGPRPRAASFRCAAS